MTVDDAVAQIEDNMVLGIERVVPLNFLFQSSLKNSQRTIKYHWRVYFIKVHLLQKLDINVVDINDVGYVEQSMALMKWMLISI